MLIVVYMHYLPNLISVLRMLLTVPIGYALLNTEYQLALVLFIVAIVSDGLDGWLARKYLWRSKVGAFLDPMADKLLITTVFIVFGYTEKVPFWLILLVILRDLLIIGSTLWYYLSAGPFKVVASNLGKIYTALVLSVITILLFSLAAPISALFIDLERLINYGFWLVGILTIVSALDYFFRWRHRFKAVILQKSNNNIAKNC